MIGWWILVSEVKSQVNLEDKKSATLVHFEAGLSSRDWVEDLVAASKASKFARDGCMLRYQARASAVLPILDQVLNQLRDDFELYSKPEFNFSKIATCLPDDLLNIEFWDLS